MLIILKRNQKQIQNAQKHSKIIVSVISCSGRILQQTRSLKHLTNSISQIYTTGDDCGLKCEEIERYYWNKWCCYHYTN